MFSSLLTQHQFGAENFQIGLLNNPNFLNNFQSQLTADQALYDAGQTKHAVRSAELTKDMASEEGRRTQMEVIAGVIRAYYDSLLSADQLAATARRCVPRKPIWNGLRPFAPRECPPTWMRSRSESIWRASANSRSAVKRMWKSPARP